MKRVLFVLNNMNIGGTEKAFLNYINTLSYEEYEITLLLLEKCGGFLPFVPDKVQVQVMDEYNRMKSEIMDPPLIVAKNYVRSGKLIQATIIVTLHTLFKITNDRTPYYKYVLRGKQLEEKYDIAIAYCGPFDFLTVFILFFVEAKKKIQWVHFDVSKFNFNKKICRKLYPKFDEIRIVSDEARSQLIRRIPEISRKVIVHPNVVSAEQCRKMAEMGEGFTDGFKGIHIVTVGRLSEEKGQDIIPEVASQLKYNGINFKWYLIGNGKLRPTIEKMCKKCSVEDDIVFLGTQVNPYRFLQEADLYVQTSKHEGYCITLAEAKVFNIPIVSTECAGAHEQLDGIEHCIVVERNTNNLVNALVHIICRNGN